MGVGASAPPPLPTGRQAEGVRVRVAVKERYLAYLPQYINLDAALTEEKVRLVANHWNLIAEEDDTGMQDAGLAPSRISVFYDAFYEKLFEKAPKTKNLFDGNMVRQSRALVKMVSWLCNLEVTDDLVSRLEALADRHVGYGCLPLHYEAGGDALQHALRATAQDQDPKQMEVIMKDQEWFGAGGRSPVRRSSSSGPFTRSSSGRRRKKGSKGWAGGGGGGWGRSFNHRSPGAGLGGNGSDGGGGRRRRAASGGSGSTFGVLGAPWGGRGHTLVAPYADSHDGEDGGGIYPPGSPFSMASSAGSGMHLSLAGSVSTVPRNDSICASPDGSSRVSANGRSGPDAGKGVRGRRSKILRGLGMMGGPRSGGGGSAEEFGGGVPSSSPRETIGARAMAVLGGRPRRQKEGISAGRQGVPHMIAPDRRQHSRSSSVGSLSAAAETVSLVAPEGGGRNWAGAGGYGVPFPTTLSSSPRGSDLSSTYQQRRKADRSHDSSTTAATPPLASPASSALSLPVSRSWEQSSALLSARLGSGNGGGIGIGFSSKRQQAGRSLAAATPKSRTPTAAAMLRQDGGWHDTGGHGGKKEVVRKEGTPRSRQTPPATGKKSPSGFDNSGRGGGAGGRGEVDARPSRRSATGTSPRDRRQRIGRPPSPSSSLSPRLPAAAGGAVGRRQTAATATAVSTVATATATAVASIASVSPPSSAALRPYELMAERAKKAAEPTPLQLPASSTARMEKAAAHGVGGRGVSEAGGQRDLPSEALSHGDGEPEPVRELHGHQAAEGGGLREEPALLRTPGGDKTGRAHRAFPSPAKSRNGSRRAARRGDSGSRSFSRRRHRPNGEKKKSPAGVALGRVSTPPGSKGVGVADQAGVFSDDGDDGKARSSKRTGGGGKGPSRQPPVRKLSHEAATMFGFLDEEEDGGGEAEAKTEQRLNSWDRRPKSMNAADISAVDSIGANAMAFFEKKRLQKKQRGERSGNGSVVAGSPMKVKEAEEKKEDEAESSSLLRNWQPQLQALPRQEEAAEAKPGAEYDALAAAVVAPADDAKGPAHADSQLSRTPKQLGSTRGNAWQTREAILVTPPRATGGGESDEAGGRAARAVVVEPSNSLCATTGAVAHAVVPYEHASPPMWKPFRPIVGPDAAAAVAGGALRAGAKEVKVPHSTTLEPPSLGPDDVSGSGDVARPAVDAPACSLGNGNTDAVGKEDTAEACECPLGKGRADVVGTTSNGVIGKGGGATAAGWTGAPRTEERQRLRQDQLDLVKQSDKTPMTLPLMDGSTHAPEADDFSEMAMSVGPEKSRRSKQKALASPAAAAAAVMSGDGNNGGVQIGQASGARAASSAVSPSSDAGTTWLTLSSTTPVTPPSNAVSGAGLSLSREDRAVAVAGGELEEPEPVAPAGAAAAGLSQEPFGRSAPACGAHDLGGQEGGLRTATGVDDNEAPQEAACGALGTSLESSQRNSSEAAVGGDGGKAQDGSTAVAAGGARGGTQVRATGGGSVVVAAGTVSAASELWGGRSASAKARAAELRDRETAAAAAAAAAEAATADGCTVKAMNSATAKRTGGTGGAVDGTGGHDGRREKLRSTSSARAQAAAAPPPPLASPVKAKGRVAAMAARVMAGNWGRGGDTAVPVGSVAGAGGTVAGVLGDGVKAGDSRLISAKAGRGEGEGRYGGDAAGRERGVTGSMNGGRVRVESRKGPMEGLAFGNVRQRASAWDMALRS
ncbi:conserved unknown protein [Ectocarpus siliculosus]|uniref:Globin family profile domain-containing protein n=1 Tax=Ectocarpus siliculosus TaxID=2880 RepID=D7FWG0_ECTSI|nr:conserved unknown protein [Ectocarpus siliculosus]|eukprot:CBJ32048.1 conserved unknown protein [Ectocarpus siliculosus]